METKQAAIPHKFLPFSMTAGLFYLLFFLYVWQVIDPRLVHHALGILLPYVPFAFHTDWPFLQEHLGRAGGLVEYATRLLSQFYAFGWVGALIATAAAWCMGSFAGGIIRRGRWRDGHVLSFVPATILLLMYGAYNHPLGPALSVLTALGGFAIHIRLAPAAPVKRFITYLLAFLIVYYVAGSSSLLFAVLVAIDEWLLGNRRRLAGAMLACALVVPWIAAVKSGLAFTDTYAGFLVSAPGVAPMRWSCTLALYLFFPTVLAGSVLWGNTQTGETPSPAKPANPVSKPAHRSRQGGRASHPRPRCFSVRSWPTWALPALFFSGAAAATWLSLDTRTRIVLEMDYLSQSERWTEVLQSANRLPAGIYSARCNRNIILALYHTGRLGNEMFRYPQRPGVDLFNTPNELSDLGTFYQESRLFLDLGQVNLAQRCAYEALATAGEHPAILRQLAMIHLVKGQSHTAKLFLNALAKHMFYGQTSREMLHQLEADPSLENDRRTLQIRENMPSQDSIAQGTSFPDILELLLGKNPHNQMAFELLMAHYLSNGMPEKVVANLARLKDFSYPRVPRHYQEAMVIHALSSNRPPQVSGFEPAPETLQRFQEFQRITARGTSPQEAALAALEAGLGDSYFFYFTYGVSGR